MATSEQVPSTNPVSPAHGSSDPATVRCLAEARMWTAIEAKPEFRDRLVKESNGREQSSMRGQLSLLTNAYRVDRAISPRLDDLREQLRTSLKLIQPVDIYVVANPEANAFCVPSRKGTRLIMCLYSALFDLLTPQELLFVMGHEAGHALLGHTRIPKIGFDHPDFSPLEVVRLQALGRTQEISCDRVGLLACQDIRSAASALFKIMSGLGQQWLEFDEKAFAKHFDDISSLSEFAEFESGVTTHPIVPLRVKSLVVFSQSRLYNDMLGRPDAPITTADLEKSTDYMLSVVEPDLTAIESASEEEAANRLLVRGALAIVASDGVLEPTETDFLKGKGVELSPEFEKTMKDSNFVTQTLESIANDAQLLSRKLSASQRAGLLHQMCLVAASAGGIVSSELGVVIALAQMLELPPEVLKSTLENAAPPAAVAAAPKKARVPRKKRTKKAVDQPGTQVESAPPVVPPEKLS